LSILFLYKGVSSLNQSFEHVVQSPFIVEAGHLVTGEPLFIRGEIRLVPGAGAAPKPVLFISHGFKGFKDWGFFPYIATRFAEEGFYTVTYNFSCNGVNEVDFDELDKFAVNTYSREQEDLGILLQAIQQKQLPLPEHADLERIYLLGHSRGGGNSILFAAEHSQVKAVVTWNGIANPDLFDDAFKEQIAQEGIAYVANARTKQQMPIRATFYEDLRKNDERYDIVNRLSELRIPVLQVQGDQDSPRLKAGYEALRAGAPQQGIVTIEDGNHTFGAVHPFVSSTPQLEEAFQATLHFLTNL
jgi:pimeloyl-ACP methyl ester carboxylesterase